ncbi:hypothetical protein K4H28_04915 [Deefgea tanakiae]|uniref:Uncharacterized protein n=1 Tax=Deefgea tanakiae TaxID=2865840 RepID=A0ABX8Z833_9NEIS|nr:hypothetical protein [Deefgea tanakiae]QZA78751.1 hypothetical protein K4H28_04915 [Deefgea tanakiae]
MLPIAAVLGWFLHENLRQKREEAQTKLKLDVEHASLSIEQLFGFIESDLKLIAQRRQIMTMDRNKCDSILNDYMSIRGDVFMGISRK